jgi:catechol-2,3-dioxygenase
LRHWHQAPKESALNHKETSVNAPTTLGPIGQISRSVSNIKDAQTWYADVLGIPHLYTFGKLAFFDCSGIRLIW